MKQILYSVGIRDEATGEQLNLKVWAENVDKATAKINELFCAGACYRWTGTGPMHNDKGEVITRIVDEV